MAIDGLTAASAYIMGRNMFGPGRGEWDLSWQGWWGEELRLHVAPVVLGKGGRLFEGVGDTDLEIAGVSGTGLVTHVTYRVAH